MNPFHWIAQHWHRRTASLSTAARRSLYVSIGLHAVVALAAGGIIVSHIFYNRETTFQGTPPPARQYDPRKLEFKVKVSKQARSSSRPSLAPRLVSAKANLEMSLPAIKMDPKVVSTTFQPKFKAVTGMGLGAGLGTGYGSAGFGEGVSAINFFGIQAKGERIAVCVDVSVSMCEAEKGGIAGYLMVKERVNQVVEALKDGTLFNVIAFADACSAMEPKMVYAGAETRQKARQFLQPFNSSEASLGLDSGNFSGVGGGLAAAGGTTRLDLALAAAMQMAADTILVISDGLPEVTKIGDPNQVSAYNNMIAQWRAQNAGAIAAAQTAIAAYNAAEAAAPATRVWIPEVPARPPGRAGIKEGAKADPGSPAIPGHWQVVQHHPGGVARPAMPAPPPMPPPGKWKLPDFVQHISLLYDANYKPKGLKPPVISCIGYQIDKDGGAFLNQLSANYKGQYRLVRKMR